MVLFERASRTFSEGMEHWAIRLGNQRERPRRRLMPMKAITPPNTPPSPGICIGTTKTSERKIVNSKSPSCPTRMRISSIVMLPTGKKA